jgi:hypothetical protein
VGARGYVMSCLALNGAASRGTGSSGAYLVLENPRAWLPGALACAEPGYKEELQWAGRR